MSSFSDFVKTTSRILIVFLSLCSWSYAQAAGNPTTGATIWSGSCSSCHGNPQTTLGTAFSGPYGPTANSLSVYALDTLGAAIATAASPGYPIPTNPIPANIYAGANTSSAGTGQMGNLVGSLGTQAAPLQNSIDLAAYFDSFFVPAAPTIGTAVAVLNLANAATASVTVPFTAPTGTGSSVITSYTMTAYSGGLATGFTGTGTASPITVSGLAAGTAYTFKVTATNGGYTNTYPTSTTNAVNTSPASSASNSVTPATVPGAPTIGTATLVANVTNATVTGSATVTFTAPASTGGSAITGYTVISSPAGGTDSNAGTTGTSHIVTGLTAGTAYTFTVKATNIMGTGGASGATSPALTAATVPAAPTIGTATLVANVSNATVTGSATVTFTAPGNIGGSAITGYTVTSSPVGGVDSNAGTTNLSHTITGLTAGTAYTFSVKATNIDGASLASGATTPALTAATVPGAPNIGTATAVLNVANATTSKATVTFTAPASIGGSAITGYTVTSSPAGGTDSNAGSTALSHTITGLTSGSSYSFTVTATNIDGTSLASVATNPTIIPATVPGAPNIGSATAVLNVTNATGTGSADATFTAPSSNGGLAITGYTVTSSPAGGVDSNAGTTGISHRVTGLTVGANYTFTVTATNAMGTGLASNATTQIATATVPGAPTIGTATAADSQATVPFTAPASTGGAPITGYTVTSSPAGGVDSNAGQTGLSHVVTGLTNTTNYTFSVTATNSAGTSIASGVSNIVQPLGVAGSAVITSVVPGNNSALVNFTPPASFGIGNSFVSYTATSNPAAGTGSSTSPTATSINVTGLTNGTQYTFSIIVNVTPGVAVTSSPSGLFTPATVPGAPTIGTATAVTGLANSPTASATVTFSAPASDGGSAITGYTVISSPAGGTDSNAGSTSLSHTITGLTAGAAYTFTVKATNIMGTGGASGVTSPITPATVPGAPTIGTATAVTGLANSTTASATVTFTAPASNGGSAITGYTVTSNSGGTDSNAGSTGLSHSITGLTAGTYYTFTVTATNTAGTSLASAATTSIVVATVPGAPTGVTASPVTGLANAAASSTTVSFTAPASNGGVSITGYTVTSSPSGGIDSNAGSTSLSHIITGLTAGTAYSFIVTATNSAGTSLNSGASTPVTPSTVPGTPTNIVAVMGNNQATVTFTAPNTGGAAITGYTVISSPSGGVDSNAGQTGTSHVVTGLANGTPYTFTVVATNISGQGQTSGISSPIIPAGPPGAPTGISPVMGNGQVQVSFTAPADNGAAISGYTVTASPGGKSATGTSSPITVNGLTNHLAYTFTVTATNIAGSTDSLPSSPVTPEAPPSATSLSTSVMINSSSNIISPTVTGTLNTSGTMLSIVNNPPHGTVTVSTTDYSFLYTPTPNYWGADSFTFTATGPGGISSVTAVKIKVTPVKPTAANATLQVQLNSSATLDLAPFISGTSISGINIPAQPAHGVVVTAGTKATYTPKHDYFGTDTFTYLAYGAGGEVSATAATVTVTIIGRPNPTQNPRVTSIVNTQSAAVMHFGTVQVFNFQQRLETRHQSNYNSSPVVSQFDDSAILPAPIGGTVQGGSNNYFNSWNPSTVLNKTNDPNSLLHAVEPANNGRPTDNNPVASLVASLVTGLASNASLNLGAISNTVGAANKDSFSKLDFWAAGNLRFGTSSTSGVDTKFATDGISIGVDKRLDRKLTVGMGMGYSVDNSTIGTDGTYSKSTGVSIAGYSSYLMDAGTFVDILLGYGKVNFDTNRYVPSVDDFAKATRKGVQLFGSFSFGYDYHDESFLLSPYGRYDFSYDQLDAFTETGAGLNPLFYGKQKMTSSSLAAGLRAQSSHQTDFGLVSPRARIELQHSTQAIGDTSVAYADLLDTQYGIAGSTQNNNSFVIGIGSDFLFSESLKIALDYQRLNSPGTETYQAINFRLTKTLDGKNDFAKLLEESYSASIAKPSGLMTSAGYTFDTNVTRASDATDIRSDAIYSFSASKAMSVTVSKFTKLKLSGFIETEQFRSYTGLSHISGGGEAEFMYRTSGDFGAPTFGIFARFTDDAYESTLRDGTRSSAGLTFRMPVTDRINCFAALSDNVRAANTEVFNTQDVSFRTNLDYQINMKQAFYVTGEYRKGDIVSSAQGTLKALDMAAVTTPDDVFKSPQFQDYRMKGKTSLLTLGYNVSLGTKDSLDFSWRGVLSKPDFTPDFSSPASYSDSQYSAVYLMIF